MPKTIFEKIAAKEIPSHIIWENDTHMAFLDINPLAQGHTLVIPKENQGDYLFDLENNHYHELMRLTKEIAELLKRKLECDRVFVIVEGLEVPHVHVHLIPSSKDKPLHSLEKITVSSEELATTKNKIVN